MQFIVSAGLIAAIVLWGLVSPASLDSVFGTALAGITRNFGWFYLWVVLGMVVLAGFLAFSRWGDLKLGDEDDEPEFSLGAWFAMLFAAGMGIGLVFWGVAEPISHYVSPPPGVVAGTEQAASVAMRYAFFHWGLHPWAIYGIVGLSIAFYSFRRKALPLVSSATEALPWRFAKRLSPAFNVLAVVATAFGVAASTPIRRRASRSPGGCWWRRLRSACCSRAGSRRYRRRPSCSRCRLWSCLLAPTEN